MKRKGKQRLVGEMATRDKIVGFHDATRQAEETGRGDRVHHQPKRSVGISYLIYLSLSMRGGGGVGGATRGSRALLARLLVVSHGSMTSSSAHSM